MRLPGIGLALYIILVIFIFIFYPVKGQNISGRPRVRSAIDIIKIEEYNSYEIQLEECVMADSTTALSLKIPNLSLPLSKLRVTSPFGSRIHPVTGKYDFHKGVDLAARNNIVYTILDGHVTQAAYGSTLGNFVRINHGDFQSVYGHLSLILISPGADVIAGQTIGITGATGRVTGEHLHFAVFFKGTSIDPLLFLYSFKDSSSL